MHGTSSRLKGFTGGNPFQESQARTYGDDKVVSEFYPTTFFWSLFNEQHEILLGTRGSGKTILLKMLTYSCIRRFVHEKAGEYVTKKNFIGFYVPLHLEFIISLPGLDVPLPDRLSYFRIAFNCVAAKALLGQIACLLDDIEKDPKERLKREAQIVDHIAPMWCFDPDLEKRISSLKDLVWYIDLLYSGIDREENELLGRVGQFSKRLMAPIVNILPRLTEDLGLDVQKTNWLACIDEAEFLTEPFIKCINTFLRSEKRPLVVKMATLPFKHLTRDTLEEGVSIEPDGNDFNYRIIDAPWDSDDFIGLCNQICRVRLARCGINDPDLTLDKFLGVVGHKDDMIDYFRLELPDEATEPMILKGIQQSLSERRRSHLASLPDSKEALGKPYLNRFSPVYFMRRMREENAKGARVAGWFAGAKMVRRIADGNPRRFIQIMNAFVEKARETNLEPKDQHRILTDFCESVFQESEALPGFGLLLKGLIAQIGELLSDRVHGKWMLDSGCNFKIEQDLIQDINILDTIKLAVNFLHMRVEKGNFVRAVDENTEFRLCFIYGVKYWLPMRKGDPFILRSRHRFIPLNTPRTKQEAKQTLSLIDLELKDDNQE